MKKVLLAVLFFLGTMTPVLAEDTTVSVTNATGQKGDTVKVQIKLSGNPNFGLLGLKVDYDTTVLSYQGGKTKNLDRANLSGIEEVDGTVTMYALTISDLMDDTGVIAEMTFQIKEDTVTETPLIVRVTDYGIDENNPLPYQVKAGKVAIVAGQEETDSSQEVGTQEEKDASFQEEYATDELIIEQESSKVIGSEDENQEPKEEESTNAKSYRWIIGTVVFFLCLIGGGWVFQKRKVKKDVKP